MPNDVEEFEGPASGLVKISGLLDSGAVSRTGLRLPDTLSFDEWAAVGSQLQLMEGSVLWWLGDWMNFGERRYGETYAQALDETDYAYQTINSAKYVSGAIEFMRRRINLTWSHHREVAPLEPDEQDYWLEMAEKNDWTRKELRKALKDPKQLEPIDPPTGEYHCIVIDPPWFMEKIDRDVRPKQKEFDYPPMDEEALSALHIPAAAECHLYCWTTHKHLPMAFRLVESWGFKYECLMTWVKNVGFTPFSWMRSTEHVLFCRKGGLDLLQKGRRLDFNAKVREHSRKPDEFYALIAEVSPGPRLDMFSRESRDGFDSWGNEVGKLDA